MCATNREHINGNSEWKAKAEVLLGSKRKGSITFGAQKFGAQKGLMQVHKFGSSLANL